jgi:hypothetical protein
MNSSATAKKISAILGRRVLDAGAAAAAVARVGAGGMIGARRGAGRALSATSAPELPEASSDAAVTAAPVEAPLPYSNPA